MIEKKVMAPKKIVVRPGQAQLISTASNQGQQIIVLPSNFLQQISGNTTIKIPPAASTSRPSIVVPASAGLKRPASASGTAASEAPARKRANLDHMTPEEKLNRRKLKNRVAAQNARDKKKFKMDEIEEKLKALEEANAKLLLENESLRALNERLMSEKCQPLTVQTTSPYQAPPPSLSPPPSEYSDRASSPGSASSISSSDCSLVDSRSFESAELINASQQKSQDRGWAGLWTAVMATMAPAAFCLAAAAAATSSPSLSPLPSLPNKETLSSKPSDTTTTKPVLPIKKRITKEPPMT